MSHIKIQERFPWRKQHVLLRRYNNLACHVEKQGMNFTTHTKYIEILHFWRGACPSQVPENTLNFHIPAEVGEGIRNEPFCWDWKLNTWLPSTNCNFPNIAVSSIQENISRVSCWIQAPFVMGRFVKKRQDETNSLKEKNMVPLKLSISQTEEEYMFILRTWLPTTGIMKLSWFRPAMASVKIATTRFVIPEIVRFYCSLHQPG